MREEITIPAKDDYPLAATLYKPEVASNRIAIVSSATAVPRGFYDGFSQRLAAAGYWVLTYDYRGIGDSKPASLRGFHVEMSDWAMLDMAGVIQYATHSLNARRVVMIGHSVGGQLAALADNADRIDAMATFSAQSGYWLYQGAEQKLVVGFHVFVTLPLLSKVFGYTPWSWFSSAEDLPGGVALQWSRWCRDPRYVLSDNSLPLTRFTQFAAPVLAYSFSDDKWGRPESVDAMMSAYPVVERRHIEVADLSIKSIGHFGFFRKSAQTLWSDVFSWLESSSRSARNPDNVTGHS